MEQHVFLEKMYKTIVKGAWLKGYIADTSFHYESVQVDLLKKKMTAKGSDIDGAWIRTLADKTRQACRGEGRKMYCRFVDKDGQPYSGQDFDEPWLKFCEAVFKSTTAPGKAGQPMPEGWEPPYGLAFKVFGFAALANPEGAHAEAFDSDPVKIKTNSVALSRQTQRKRELTASLKGKAQFKAQMSMNKEAYKESFAETANAEAKTKGFTLMAATKYVEAVERQRSHDDDNYLKKMVALKDQISFFIGQEGYEDIVKGLIEKLMTHLDSGSTAMKLPELSAVLQSLQPSPEKRGGGGAAAATVVLSDSD